MPAPDLDPTLVAIARAVREAGGRAVIVGGSVRDRLLGLPPRGDTDLELFGLDPEAAAGVLAAFGRVLRVGRAFPVLRVKGLDVDFSLPRESSAGARARGDLGAADPALGFEAAARRRDLTVNAMGLDPLSGEILDPLGGRADLEARRLRAADPARFAEDPVRGLRVARFAARLGMQPDDQLLALCAGLDLDGVAAERLFTEWRKLLLEPDAPAVALELLRRTGLLAAFPELAALPGVPQDPAHHPEGDVWVHTLMVVDAAARLRAGDDGDEALMFAALCHDLGKPGTTAADADRVRALGHEAAGVERTRAFLERLGAPVALTERVACLVRHHLAPAELPRQGAGRAAYRRLARRLDAAGASMSLLERVARADQLGRTTEAALAGAFPEGDEFLRMAALAGAGRAAPADAVQGRHLIARGLTPGPGFADILARCRALQDESGVEDPEAILDAVLGESPC
jgi:tRNA nucleotidyltransferase (CCA-adding enzyme)